MVSTDDTLDLNSVLLYYYNFTFLGNSIGCLTKSRISSVCTVVIKENFNLLDHQCWPILVQVTVLPAKSDSDLMFCLHKLSKTLTCTLHLS